MVAEKVVVEKLVTEEQVGVEQVDVEQVDVEQGSPSRVWRMLLSIVFLLAWIIFMLLANSVFRLCFPRYLDRFYQVFHGVCARAFSIRCHTKGQVSTAKPTLFLANHISYLDVFVLGSVLPGYFIAKSEVASWPILGWLAKVQNTLFFERNSRKVQGQLQVMAKHFNLKGNLILFPEGTSTEGEHVEPFKSSLLQSIDQAEEEVMIQPVTIAYTRYRKKPMNRFMRDHYAWYAKMPFASHFFKALGLGSSDVEIVLHNPVTLSDFDSRKACAAYCWQRVSSGLDEALSR